MSDWRVPYRVHGLTDEYRAKVGAARYVIRKYNPSAVVTSVSGGKDSTVLLHLVANAFGVKPRAYHIASNANLPGLDTVLAWYREVADLRVIECASLADYIERLRAIGLPHERTDAEQRSVVLQGKKERGTEVAKELGARFVFLGLRAEESKNRRFLGKTMCFSARGLIHTCPLRDWTARDVWAYIVEHDLPYLPMYDCETHGFTRETIRNTGFLTTDGLKGYKNYGNNSYVAWLTTHYPAYAQILLREFPQLARWK